VSGALLMAFSQFPLVPSYADLPSSVSSHIQLLCQIRAWWSQSKLEKTFLKPVKSAQWYF